ncbi:hypothetical protein GCM10010359_12330 [Streptomyces morookaense]|nr:hypothetical protein GCM10010359_12330 [Streptomyces morookaense]
MPDAPTPLLRDEASPEAESRRGKPVFIHYELHRIRSAELIREAAAHRPARVARRAPRRLRRLFVLAA